MADQYSNDATEAEKFTGEKFNNKSTQRQTNWVENNFKIWRKIEFVGKPTLEMTINNQILLISSTFSEKASQNITITWCQFEFEKYTTCIGNNICNSLCSSGNSMDVFIFNCATCTPAHCNIVPTCSLLFRAKLYETGRQARERLYYMHSNNVQMGRASSHELTWINKPVHRRTDSYRSGECWIKETSCTVHSLDSSVCLKL